MTDQELIDKVCGDSTVTFCNWNPPSESESTKFLNYIFPRYGQDPRVVSITFEMPSMPPEPHSNSPL